MLNEKYIMSCIQPFLNKNNEISEIEFFKLFSDLTLHEQYEVVSLLIKNDIELVEEKKEDSEIIDKAEILNFVQQNQDYKKLINLTNEQLCVMVQSGNDTAVAALLEKNKRFIYGVALKLYGQFSQTSLEAEDLFQYGNIGFLEAIKKFDVEKDFKLLTYSWHWVRQNITRAAIDFGYMIRLPVHVFEKLTKIFTIRKQHPDATKYEIAEMLSEKYGYVSIDELEKLLVYSEDYLHTSSLNALVGEGEDTELFELIPDSEAPPVEELAMKNALSKDLNKALSTLTPREQKVLSLRIGIEDGEEHTLEEVGHVFGVTRERIRQIEAKALRKLRHPSRSKKLKSYYEEL